MSSDVAPQQSGDGPGFAMRLSAPAIDRRAATAGGAALPTGVIIDPAACCARGDVRTPPAAACASCGAAMHPGCAAPAAPGRASSLLTCTYCGATATAEVAAAAAPSLAGAAGGAAHSLLVHGGAPGGGGAARCDGGLFLFAIDANATRAQMVAIANAVDAAVHELGPVRRRSALCCGVLRVRAITRAVRCARGGSGRGSA